MSITQLDLARADRLVNAVVMAMPEPAPAAELRGAAAAFSMAAENVPELADMFRAGSERLAAMAVIAAEEEQKP